MARKRLTSKDVLDLLKRKERVGQPQRTPGPSAGKAPRLILPGGKSPVVLSVRTRATVVRVLPIRVRMPAETPVARPVGPQAIARVPSPILRVPTRVAPPGRPGPHEMVPGKPEARKPEAPQRPARIMPLEREGVPSPQAMPRGEYERKYGYDRDVSAPKEGAGVGIIRGPTALKHEGRLRKTGKVCGHWAMYAFVVQNGPMKNLGLEFADGFRCYYPSTSENDYHNIVNAESGSYYVHDFLKSKGYVRM